MEIKHKALKLLILAAIMMVGISSFASAMGISIGYWKENPLTLSPGESKEVLVNLQSEKDATVQASLVSGSEVARFIDASTQYLIPAMNRDTNAHLLVQVPEDAVVGSEYTVTVAIETTDAGNGGIALGSALQMSFPVQVIEKPAAEQAAPTSNSLWVLIGAVVVIALLWALIVRMRKK